MARPAQGRCELIPHFGLEQYLGVVLYFAAIVAFFGSIFRSPFIGVCYLVPLIPLQTVRSRLEIFPLGATLTTIMMFGIFLGLLRQRRWPLGRTPWTMILFVYSLYTLASVFTNPEHLLPRLKEWWDIMSVPLLLFLVAAAVKDVRQMKILVLLMCIAVLAMDRSFWNAVSDRDYSTFSNDLQEGGAMGYAGVQGLAAFNAEFAWFMVALASVRWKLAIRAACLALGVFAANCLMYSFSRGGYVAFLAGWIFIGVAKQRKLLVLLALFGITWASVVPPAVYERVMMTYDPQAGTLDHSAEIRLVLWNDAIELFQSNPVTGTGFNTYAYMNRVGSYADTHNIYLKVLVETGIIGLALFLWLMAKTFWTGLVLFRRAGDPFLSALGLGLSAWILCSAVANLFGDRWTYMQISGYLWVLAGLVCTGLEIAAREEEPTESAVEELVETPALSPA